MPSGSISFLSQPLEVPPADFVCDPCGAWRLHPGDCRWCRRHGQDRRRTLVGSRTSASLSPFASLLGIAGRQRQAHVTRRCSSAAVLARAARLVSGPADRLPSEWSSIHARAATISRAPVRPVRRLGEVRHAVVAPRRLPATSWSGNSAARMWFGATQCHGVRARRIPRAPDRAGDGPAYWHGGREVAEEFGAILVLVVSDSLPPGLSKHSPGMHEPGALPPGQIERVCCKVSGSSPLAGSRFSPCCSGIYGHPPRAAFVTSARVGCT